MTRAVLAWGPAVLWAAVLFFLSASSDPSGAALFEWLPAADKLAHLVLYGVLGVLLARGRGVDGVVPHGVVILVGALYGMSDEWHQSFVPGRQVSAADWVADLCGLSAGYWIALALMRRRVYP